MARIHNYVHLKFPTGSIIIYFNKENQRYTRKVKIIRNMFSYVHEFFVVRRSFAFSILLRI
jgi:hypothetical protein